MILKQVIKRRKTKMSTDESGTILPQTDGESTPERHEPSVTPVADGTPSPAPVETGSEPADKAPAEDSPEVPEPEPGDIVVPPDAEVKTPEEEEEEETTDPSGDTTSDGTIPGIGAEEIEEVNIARGDIYIYKDSGADKKKPETPDDSFSDPTQELPENPAKFSAFHSPGKLESYFGKWIEDRLLLLGGIGEDILYSTAYQLIEREQFRSYERRYLYFADYNSDRNELILEMFRKYRVGRGEKMIVLIDIEDQGAFYDSIFKTPAAAKSIKEYLIEKDILLIAIVKNHLMNQVELNVGKGFYFAHWKMGFLSHLLKNFFPENTGELEKKIIGQRKKKVWGDKNDDHEFYDNLVFELMKGADSFLELVEKRQEYIDDLKKPVEFSEHSWEIRAGEVFKNSEPYKTVLYAGAFFSKLPPLDFDRMVNLLLDDKTAAASKTTRVTSYSGEDKTIETDEPKKAVEIWDDNADSILTQCKLKAVSDDSSSQYIGFVQPYLENDLKKYFKEIHPIYMRQQFRPIQESGILFRSDISPNISNNIVRLAVRMAILNPTYYGADWLKDFIVQLRSHYDIKDTTSATPMEAVLKYFENQTHEMIRRHFYAQVSKLTREMLNHEQLKIVVKNFLNHLFQINAHDAVLHIALNVGKRMFPSRRSEFDQFYWFKRLLDQGPDDIKNETYEALHKVAINNHHDIYIVTDSIMEWVPEPGKDKDEDNLSPSNTFALLFFHHYCFGILGRVKDKHYGRWPSKYPLFRPFYKDNSHMGQLEEIIRCLLHPYIQKASKTSGKSGNESEFDLYAYITAILEEWGLVLLGWDFEKAKPDAETFFHTLTRLIIAGTKPFQHSKIFKKLIQKRSDYKSEFTARRAKKKPEDRKKLAARYKMIDKLIGLCKQLIAEQKGRET
jgi:hypothetical protein